MTQAMQNRHILPCRHKGAERRIYVVWRGEGDGKQELDEAMKRFGESEYDAEVSPAEHFKKIADFLRSVGFDEVKP